MSLGVGSLANLNRDKLNCSTACCWQVADHLAGLPTYFAAHLWPRAVGTVGLRPACTGVGNRALDQWVTRDDRARCPHLQCP